MTAAVSHTSHALDVAYELISAGVPIFVARRATTPTGTWRPDGGTGNCGYWLPTGWENTPANPTTLDTYKLGDALGAVMGHTLDLLDVDPRNGGDVTADQLRAAGLWPTVYARAETPSGGYHEFVTPLRTGSRDGVRPGLDVKSGRPDGTGRGFAFIAPTVKISKTTGMAAVYRWTLELMLDEIDVKDDSGTALAEIVTAALSTKPGATGAPAGSLFGPTGLDIHTGPIPDGERHAQLVSYAGYLLTRGVGYDLAEKLMRSRLADCAQPPKAATPVTWDEALGKLRDVYHRYAAPGKPHPDHQPANDDSPPTGDVEMHSGQIRMAYRLAADYANQLLHVAGIGWHTWDGRRWHPDNTGTAKRAVYQVLRSGLIESLEDKRLRADIQRCESASGVNGVLDLAAALEPFAATVADLDADPYLLNVANGTLDLRMMELRPHTPNDRMTKVARAAWEPDAPTARWGTFLAQVLPDAEVREFLQRVSGVGLLGLVVEHVLPILTGTGANGKGTFYKAVSHALGDYASTVEPDLFLHRQGAHPTGEMDLLGIRWCVVSETEKDRRLAEATMKRLTGGDTIRARRMRQDFIEFTPSHTAIMVTNHLPKVSGDDPAIWRRLRVIPFDVVIAAEDRDKHLDEQLQLDANAVLAWAVAGYADYAARGELAEPDSVLAATERYHLSSDAVARFIEACCIKNSTMSVETSALFSRWAKWSVLDGTEQISQRAFGEALDSHGYPQSKSHGRRLRRGLDLYADEDSE
jgi:putative DNA primase/helicase